MVDTAIQLWFYFSRGKQINMRCTELWVIFQIEHKEFKMAY